MPGPPGGLALYTANVVLGAVLVGPFVVFYWQGTWGVQDVYFFPSDTEYSSWLSFSIGFLGTYLNCFTQSVWTDLLRGTNKIGFVVFSRIYTLIGAFCIVAYWRGVWGILDVYTGTDLVSDIFCVAVGLSVMCVTRTLNMGITPPLAIFMDTDRDGYFKYGTWFNTKAGITWKFAGDTLFTVIINTSCVVVTWRGLWGLLDQYLYPGDTMRSCLWSLVIYLCAMLVLLAMQYPMCHFLYKLEANANLFVLRLVVQNVFALPMVIGSVNYWRGGWNMLKYFFMTDHKEIEVWLTHSVGTLGLLLILAFTSIPCRGCCFDGDRLDGTGAFLDLPVVQGYRRICRNSKVEEIMGEELKKALSVLKNELCSQQSQEFKLPVEYHCEDDENMVIHFSQDITVDVDKELKKALSVLKNELCSQQSQEFKLPVEYHCEDDANVFIDFSQDTTVDVDKDNSTAAISMLRRGVHALLEETRYRCSVIRDFDLPFGFVQNELEATDTNFQSVNTDKVDVNVTIQKKRRPRKSNTRAKRQQDRDRKRKQRNEQRQNITVALGDITDTPVENLGTPWKKMYKENIEYKQKKKAYSKLRYKLNVAYRQVKKNMIKRRYMTDSKFQQAQKNHSKSKYNLDSKFRKVKIDLSKTKYRRNLSFQQKVRDRSRTKYANDLEFQKKVKDASKNKYANDPEFQKEVKAASKNKYANDPEFQKEVKTANKNKYANDPEFQKEVKAASKNKYANDPEFQKEVKAASKNKYANDPEFQKKVKAASKNKYANDPEFQKEVKAASKNKYANDPEFQKEVKAASKNKYANDPEFQETVKDISKNKYANDPDFKDSKRKLSVLRYRENILLREKYKRRLKQQYHHELLMRQRKIAVVQQRRLTRKECKKNLHDVSQWFKEQVRDGPTFVCSVCYKFKFRKQVIECDKDKYSKKGPKSQAMADQCISNQFCLPCDCGNYCENSSHKLWLCHTCNCHLLKGSMPPDANVNGLQMRPIPDALKSLNKLEKQLIALRIPFMKMIQLPKGSQRGVIGPCVSIPTDIEKTTSILPRFEDDVQLIRCKLKRKLAYKGHSQYEFVSTKRIRQSLEILKERNELYRDTSLNLNWEESMADIIEEKTNTPELEGENVDDTNDTEEEDQTIIDRGLPSDTCLQPVDIGQEILDQHFDNIFRVAPGEGKTPVSMMQEVGNEAMSFPAQFPEGTFGSFDSERQVRITRSRYFQARLLSADSRFSTDSSYLFYAQYLSELEQVVSKVSIAMRKSSGKDATGNVITANMLTDRDQLKTLLTTDQGYKFLTPIRGTPPYWQAALRDLMAMIRQLGIPTWFATFSAADLRWSEILEVLLKNQNSQESVEDLDWAGKAELLKNNPVMNAVLFNRRFHTFLKEIIIKREAIGKVRDHFHRIEFQQRGSPHAHCLFWIQDAPQFDQEDDQTVCDFIDR